MTQANLSPPQFHQMPLFMTAREIKAHYKPSPVDRLDTVDEATGQQRRETDEEVWARKAEEARGSGHAADMDREGPTGVIGIRPTRGYMLDGHHRVAYMAETQPDRLMPVSMRWPD